MSSTASYHLPEKIQSFIAEKAEENGVSRGKFLVQLVNEYNKLKDEKQYLEQYLLMSVDQDFLRDQVQESEDDLAVERKYNLDIWSK